MCSGEIGSRLEEEAFADLDDTVAEAPALKTYIIRSLYKWSFFSDIKARHKRSQATPGYELDPGK